MLNIMKYSFKVLFRNKTNIFWVLAFPIALGTLFNIAFGSMDEKEAFHAIPVAIVLSDDEYGDAMKEAVDSVSNGDNPLLVPQYVDADEATELLKSEDVIGIITSSEVSTLSISSGAQNKGPEKSILNIFVERFNLNANLISNVAKEHPENLPAIIDEMTRDVEFESEVSIQKSENVSTYTQYFYNQMAMACMFAAGAGILIACRNQGNLSSLAARKNVSATKKSVTILCEIIANTIVQFALNLVGFIYLAYVLKVGIDVEIPRSILALFVGVFCGISLGYLIGSIGKKDENFKSGIMFAITLPLCFFSGLMIGDMKMIVENTVPWFNRINPPALISDCFYSLAIFESYNRYNRDLLSIIIISIVFIATGLLLTRRSSYASL